MAVCPGRHVMLLLGLVSPVEPGRASQLEETALREGTMWSIPSKVYNNDRLIDEVE
jgi:hypothetical protein